MNYFITLIKRNWLFFIIMTAVLIFMNILQTPQKSTGEPILSEFISHIITIALINVLMAVSLNLVNGFTGQLSLGHGGFMCIGAYSASMITKIILPASGNAGWLVFILALIIGGITSGLIGYLIGLPTLRLKGDYLAIVTLGFSEVIRSIMVISDDIANVLNSIGLVSISNVIKEIGGPRGITGIDERSILPVVLIIVAIGIIMMRNLIYSSFGRAFQSISEDEIASETMGINTTKYKTMAFSISAFWAGVGGGLLAHKLLFISPNNFTFLKSIEYLIYVYAGGIGSISGSILSAMGLTCVLEFTRTLNLDEWRFVFYALLLIVLMLKKPAGLMGNKEFRFMIPREYR
ncbi:MAG: branched-chain amino acid ABC transporter permease [Candidatus Coatesbacteria bacterium]|nr:branched-chain amino acid ABC transporter permease [Candidatus Coatesbacteria bacterium]